MLIWRKEIGINDDTTDKRHVFDDPDVYQLDNMVRKTLEESMQFFTDINLIAKTRKLLFEEKKEKTKLILQSGTVKENFVSKVSNQKK